MGQVRVWDAVLDLGRRLCMGATDMNHWSSRKAEGHTFGKSQGKVDVRQMRAQEEVRLGTLTALLPVTQTRAGTSAGTESFPLPGNPAIFCPLHFQKRYTDFKCHWAAVWALF